jgi:hypothetical protein
VVGVVDKVVAVVQAEVVRAIGVRATEIKMKVRSLTSVS